MYDSGFVSVMPGATAMPAFSRLPRVRGCTGNTIGSSREMRPSAPMILASTSGSSTFDGRCSVTTP